MPWLRRGAQKRHRRERTATEVAPPHSPHAAPRLTLHVPPHHILTDVLKKKVVRFASIIYNFYCGIVVISLRHLQRICLGGLGVCPAQRAGKEAVLVCLYLSGNSWLRADH